MTNKSKMKTAVVNGDPAPTIKIEIPDGKGGLRPKYLIQVKRSWAYGPRAKFWDIMRWKEVEDMDGGGYWTPACLGGLAYTNLGMWRAINRRLKKMKFGYVDEYYNLNKDKINLN